ncbi:N-acyl homoserine lactonase family protein [Nocardioides nitrophenolicus]|uniref:N-acyl homoserine lactonase family protein n=1 Tax=Nocardioides nitrophenolicus TaxID=60489 RepID=UPI001EF7B134|nr:N-acyl homoserine lactonase family protein [Nocardioides nitrophenolicus]MBM7519724.1 N-acyl homoserine lactone hydrolase [Nocardioides nitrophenolicus]
MLAMRVDDVRRIDLGSFVRPAEETGTGRPRVEAVLGYAVRTAAGLLLLDTGMGDAGAETEAHYRPTRVPLPEALAGAGLRLDDVDLVVNCHLHFDHIGGNPLLAGRPVLAQRGELESARGPDYTVPELVDFPGARYELLDGETELAPGVLVVPTPGHVDGHQSLVVTCTDGTVVLAGQAHDTAAEWAAHAASSAPSAWMRRILALDPRRVVFAHDAAVWAP